MRNFFYSFLIGVIALGGCAKKWETTQDVHKKGVYPIDQIIRYYAPYEENRR